MPLLRRPSFPASPSSGTGTWARRRTFSSISLPGLKVTTHLGGTSTLSPVRGLRALRALRRLTSKTPKLRSSMRPCFDEGVDDGLEGLLHDLLGLKLRFPNFVSDLLDDFFLGHGSILLTTRPADPWTGSVELVLCRPSKVRLGGPSRSESWLVRPTLVKCFKCKDANK